MTTSTDPESIDRFVLRWHRAATTFSPAALPRWLLTSLATLVAFTGGMWVLGVGAVGPGRAAVAGSRPGEPGASGPVQPGSLHTVGLPDEALAAGDHHWLFGQALGLAATDPGRAAASQLGTSASRLRAGQPVLVLREPDAPADRQQMLVLLRETHHEPFGSDERRLVERLGPHAMQAVDTAQILAEARGAANGTLAVRPVAGVADPRADAWATPIRPASPGAEPSPVAPAAPAGPAALTDIERAVARLHAAGQPDREITRALGLPPGAVREHLRQVFTKLGVASRAQVGAALDGSLDS